jgi:hypothetical protein
LISFTRFAKTETFGIPTVPDNAGNCRFVFVTHTSSMSINVNAPTPDLAKASTTHDPTPPTPITATCAARNRSIASRPYNRPIPPNRSK